MQKVQQEIQIRNVQLGLEMLTLAQWNVLGTLIYTLTKAFSSLYFAV